MAKETGFAPDYVKEAGEYVPDSFLSAAFSNRMFGPTNEDILWEHQYRVITELAEKSFCVIVGRCSDYILRDYDRCVSLFLHAPLERRVARIIRTENMDEAQARAAIARTDRRRADNYDYYTNQTWGYSDHYDLCIDTRLGREFILDAVREVMKQKEAVEG